MVVAFVVEHEVVADFQLCAQTEVHSVHFAQLVEVEPELRLAHRDELAADILVVPYVKITGEGA